MKSMILLPLEGPPQLSYRGGAFVSPDPVALCFADGKLDLCYSARKQRADPNA